MQGEAAAPSLLLASTSLSPAPLTQHKRCLNPLPHTPNAARTPHPDCALLLACSGQDASRLHRLPCQGLPALLGWPVLQVSLLYTAPTAIRSLMAKGDSFVNKHSRKSLRVLGTVGEPINPAGQPAAMLPACSPVAVCAILANLALIQSAPTWVSAAVMCWTCYSLQLSLAPAHCRCAVQPHNGLDRQSLLPGCFPNCVMVSHASALWWCSLELVLFCGGRGEMCHRECQHAGCGSLSRLTSRCLQGAFSVKAAFPLQAAK